MRWKRVLFLLFFASLLGGAIWFFLTRMEREKPAITFGEELQYIGKKTEWSFTATDRKSGLRQLKVWVRQGSTDAEAFTQDFPAVDWRARGGIQERTVTLTLDPAALQVADGTATVIVAAQDNSLWGLKGNSTFLNIPVVVDTKPPRVDLLSTVHNIRPGGTGLVAFRLSESPAKAGVEVDGTFFPAYPEAGGGEGAHVGFFALDHDVPRSVRLAIVAADEAGNETRRIFPSRILDKKFPRDTIRLSDGFLERKVPEFQSEDPSLGSNLLEAYLTVNRKWRQENHDRIREVCAESSPERLWGGAFMQMPNTKNMSAYAVKRNYVYRGRIVDTQVHLGIDLASTAGAPVPAANGGIVVFAESLGIYGQTVIVDHGQGLFTLYSHLSGISVSVGDRVERGAAVGASGQTGMAGGDHLHFSVLVSGEFANPLEWLDGHWIADNVNNKLALFAPLPAE
jgi:hypothetical protein